MQAFAYRFFLIFCCFALVLGVVAMLFDWEPEDPQLIDPRKLRALTDWQAVHLSSVLNRPVDAVCVLVGYQPSVFDDVPYRDRMNAHLKATKYASDEKDWAFVFIHGETVTVQKFHGLARGLDLLTGHRNLPKTFKAVTCTTIDRARIMKIPGPTVILGEDR